MFSSQHSRFFQPSDSKFGSINGLPLIITTSRNAAYHRTTTTYNRTPEPTDNQPEPQITVEEPTEFKETQIFYENLLYDDINLEDIYTNYLEDDFEEHKQPKKSEVL